MDRASILGQVVLIIWGTLLMAQAMDRVSIATKMEQYTKDNGKMIDEMEKDLTLGQMATSM